MSDGRLSVFVGTIVVLLAVGVRANAARGTCRDAAARDVAVSADASRAAVDSLDAWLADPAHDLSTMGEQAFARVPLTRQDAARASARLWDWEKRRLRAERRREFQDKVLKEGMFEMRFEYRVFGEKPPSGRRLFISMHGGGAAPRAVNDRQWQNQIGLYQPEEGVYVAPRAPTDTWDLWHQGHIDPLFERLIEDMIVFEEVDPNRVYLMGYSAGGDGVYQLAPRMSDRFAAAAMMAGHPNETSPLGLRNLPFTIHVGGRDAAYNRNRVARQWQEQLAALHKQDPGGYEHWVKIYDDKAHWLDREDAAAVPWMAKFERRVFPRRVVWKQDNVTHSRFYWLAVDRDQEKAGTLVTAEVEGQRIDVRAEGVERIRVRLHDELVDLDQSVRIASGDTLLCETRPTRSIAMLAQSMRERPDGAMLFPAEIEVALPTKR